MSGSSSLGAAGSVCRLCLQALFASMLTGHISNFKISSLLECGNNGAQILLGPQSSLSETQFSVLGQTSVGATPEPVAGACHHLPGTNPYWKQLVSNMDWQIRSHLSSISPFSSSFSDRY